MIIWPIIIAIGCLFSMFVGHVFVYWLCEALDLIAHLSDHEKKVARYIGYFERFILTLLVCLEQWAAMSFVLMARSIVRHSEQNSTYVLLGTFANAACSLLTGTLCLLVRAWVLNQGVFA